MDASLHLSLPLSSVSSPPPSAPSLRFVARRSRSQAPNRSRNICTGGGGGWGAGGERPVRALIRDERVMSLTNKPSRYERFFWIAWRPMSWFLLSPRFDATDARPFLSTRPPLARRSLFTTVFKFFQFYLPRVRFIPCLFTRYTALFASSLIQKFCLLSYVYSLSNLLRRIYIFASYCLQFDSYLMDEIQSWTTLAQGSRKWLLFDWKGNTKYMDLFDFVKATGTTKVNHWRNCTFFAQFSFLVIDSCKLIKTLVLLRS